MKLPSPTIRLETPKPPTGVPALLRLAAAGLVELEDELLERITTAAAILQAAEAQAAQQKSLAAIDARSEAARLVRDTATKGGDVVAIRSAAAFVHEHEQATADALAEYQVLRGAAAGTGAGAAALTPGIGEELEAVLRDTLEAAREPTAILDASDFDYGDPSALLDSSDDVRRAFGRLYELAERHDLIRSSAVAMWQDARGWAGIERFAGAGVVQVLPYAGAQLEWRYEPAGHPVARLVAAALAVDVVADAVPLT
jgi:hypothetical protein